MNMQSLYYVNILDNFCILPSFIMLNALHIYGTYVRNMFCGCCLFYEFLCMMTYIYIYIFKSKLMHSDGELKIGPSLVRP